MSFNDIAKFILKELIKELLFQKHKATGNLIKGINVVVEKNKNIVEIVGYSKEKYTKYVDGGRRPRQRRPPIDVIVDWIRIRKIRIENNATIRQVAFLISRAIGEKGTLRRWKFGIQPSRQTEFVEVTLESNKDKIESMIDKVVIGYGNAIIENIMKNERISYLSEVDN